MGRDDLLLDVKIINMLGRAPIRFGFVRKTGDDVVAMARVGEQIRRLPVSAKKRQVRVAVAFRAVRVASDIVLRQDRRVIGASVQLDVAFVLRLNVEWIGQDSRRRPA